MSVRLQLFSVTLAAACLLGCSTGQPMRIDSIPDTGSLDLGKGRAITAVASGFQLFTALPTTASTRHQRAFQALRDQALNEAIAEVTLTESWYYVFMGTVYKTRIDAIAYPRRRW